mgnify:CR=1 FL=1
MKFTNLRELNLGISVYFGSTIAPSLRELILFFKYIPKNHWYIDTQAIGPIFFDYVLEDLRASNKWLGNGSLRVRNMWNITWYKYKVIQEKSID